MHTPFKLSKPQRIRDDSITMVSEKKEAFQLLKHNRGLLLHLHYTTLHYCKFGGADRAKRCRCLEPQNTNELMMVAIAAGIHDPQTLPNFLLKDDHGRSHTT